MEESFHIDHALLAPAAQSLAHNKFHEWICLKATVKIYIFKYQTERD
jgi:hypothetical protein